MTGEDQIKFMHDLTSSVREEFVDLYTSGKIPAEWDGHEVREWLYIKFDNARASSMKDKRCQRRKDFDNAVIINNL